MLSSPLEQFQVVSFFNIEFASIHLPLTNSFLISFLTLLGFIFFMYYSSSRQEGLQEVSLFFFPGPWQKALEFTSDLIAQLISDIILTDNEKYFPVISVLFHFICFSNLAGLIPYSFTVTSHLIITFTLAFSVFMGINFITFKKYGIKIFSLFLPSNTSFFLALLLVPIELISYIAKPISLGVRLFINLMAGHSLLKVIGGFSWGLLLLENFTSVGFLIPLFIILLLFGLELGVALIQTYVFIVLTCLYIQDAS